MKQFFNRSCGILGFCCKETALSVGGSSARCAGAADFCGKPLGFSRSLILLPVVLPLSPSFGRTTAAHLRMLVDELQTTGGRRLFRIQASAGAKKPNVTSQLAQPPCQRRPKMIAGTRAARHRAHTTCVQDPLAGADFRACRTGQGGFFNLARRQAIPRSPTEFVTALARWRAFCPARLVVRVGMLSRSIIRRWAS
jgi:hypothetical protein